jgi:tRNA U34 5-carboxymethylaminomethyl modifying GTPase MnmE/TrmE
MTTEVNQDRFKELAAFDRLRQNIAGRMDKLADSLENSLGKSQAVEDLRHHSTELRAGVFRVLVMGDFNRGKSTLLNALLGSEVLPINATPTTAVITIIRYGDEPKVRVLAANKTETEMTFDEFKGHYQLNIEDGTVQDNDIQDRFSQVAQAVVEYPLELCRNNVELVDSPGLNDHPARTARVMQQLAQTDAVIFVFDAMHFYTQQERDYLENLQRRHGLTNIFFIVNAWDNIEKSSLEPEKDMAKIRDRMLKELNPSVIDEDVTFSERVFEVSALTALRSRWLRKERQPRDPVDEEMLEQSGLPAFERDLELFLRNKRGFVVMQRAERAASIVLDNALAEIRSRLNTLDVEVSELEARMQRTQPYFAKLERVRNNITRAIDEVNKTQQRTLYESFYQFFREVDSRLENDAKGFMNEKEDGEEVGYNPKNTLGNVKDMVIDQEGFRKRLAAKYNRQSTRYFNRKLTEWQEQARAQLQTALEQLRDQFQGYAEEYNELVAAIRSEFEGRPVEDEFAFKGGLNDAAETLNRWFSASDLFSDDPAKMAAGTNIALMDVVKVLGAYGVTYAVVAGFAGLVGAILLPGLVLTGPILLITAVAGTVVGSRIWADQITVKYVEQTRQKLLPEIAEREPQLKGEISRVFSQFSSQVGQAISKEIEGLRQSLKKTIERKRQLEGQIEAERSRLESAQKEAEVILADLRQEIKNFFNS